MEQTYYYTTAEDKKFRFLDRKSKKLVSDILKFFEGRKTRILRVNKTDFDVNVLVWLEPLTNINLEISYCYKNKNILRSPYSIECRGFFGFGTNLQDAYADLIKDIYDLYLNILPKQKLTLIKSK